MKKAQTVYVVKLRPEHYLLQDNPDIKTQVTQVKLDLSKDIQTSSIIEDDRIILILEEKKGNINVRMEAFKDLCKRSPLMTKEQKEIEEPEFNHIQVILKDDSTFSQEKIGVEFKPVYKSTIGTQTPEIPQSTDLDSKEIVESLQEAEDDVYKLEYEIKQLTGFEVKIIVDWLFRKSIQFKKESWYGQISCFRAIINKIKQIVEVYV